MPEGEGGFVPEEIEKLEGEKPEKEEKRSEDARSVANPEPETVMPEMPAAGQELDNPAAVEQNGIPEGNEKTTAVPAGNEQSGQKASQSASELKDTATGLAEALGKETGLTPKG